MAAGVMIIVYLFLISPFFREGNAILDDELERKTEEIKKYIVRTGSLPSRDSFSKLNKDKDVLDGKLKELSDFVDPKKTRMSESTTEAGLYFIERLHETIKRFSEKTEGSGKIDIPENLGFGDGLPKERTVGILLRQLEVVEMVVDELLESKRIEISAIKPLKSIDYVESLSKEVFYTEMPVQVTVKTDTETLIDLLLELKNQSPVISVKELNIKSDEAESGNMEASMVLSTFKVARKEE